MPVNNYLIDERANLMQSQAHLNLAMDQLEKQKNMESLNRYLAS